MATILIIDDEASILETLELFLSSQGYTIYKASNGRDGRDLFFQHQPDVTILDIRLPELNGMDVLKQIQHKVPTAKVIMMTAFQDMDTTVQAMKNGAYDYIHKPLDIDEVEKAIEQALHVLEAERGMITVVQGNRQDTPEVIVGRSKAMLHIFKMIGLVCQNRAPVLIHGETGTGKELIARMIHHNSSYHEAPFVVMDCSAVVENLLESELFGFEKGSFTGATRQHKGKIEAAANGTLFLDEIGELPFGLQGKFLRFLQRHEYMRVGSTEMLQSHCRILAATNRNLKDMVQKGTFREDLYYRLNVVTLRIPPLRERLSDIEFLVKHFLYTINCELGTQVWKMQQGVIKRLMEHSWPGNVRELENTLVEAVVRARGQVVLLEDISDIIARHEGMDGKGIPLYSLLDMEKEHIEKTLTDSDWNRTEASRRLGISQPTLRSKIQKYGIVTPEE